MFWNAVGRLVDFSGRRAWLVVGIAIVLMAATWGYAAKCLQIRSDFLELLPRDSPGFIAFEHQLGRVGGGASLIVIAESPDKLANEKYIDDLSVKLADHVRANEECVRACKVEACREACGPQLISYVESGTKELRQFYKDNKWLYADLAELEAADDTLDQQIAIKSGLVDDLSADDGAEKKPSDQAKDNLGLDTYRDKWEAAAKKNDDFPSGYFETADGKLIGLRIVSSTSGLGDSAGDDLLHEVEAIAKGLDPSRYNAEMKIGFAGDIPNAAAEKESLVSEAIWVTGIAFLLIMGGVVFFYRSVWSLVIITLPALFGVGCAYAFATATYGYVNTSGAFLGAIILGNGINYPIVLLSRYAEFRARGQSGEEARRDAVFNAFRAELVGALVASIAYGSLTVTRFRGFSQFGTIGFVGMLIVWISIIPLVPALIVIVEGIQQKFPGWMRDRSYAVRERTSGPLVRAVAKVTQRWPWVFVVLSAILSIIAIVQLPRYLSDPWEYNFDKLGSHGSKDDGGAGYWSRKADIVFGGRMNIAGALMLGDTPSQVPLLKAKILQNAAEDPEGSLISGVSTVFDVLPGTPEEQAAKLAVLERIRDRLTPAVLESLSPEERTRVEDMRPPERLQVIEPTDLPQLLKRRFEENNGVVGTVFYVRPKNDVSLSDGHNMLRIAKVTDNIDLPDGTRVKTASRSTIFSEMLKSMGRDGPLATGVSFGAVVIVVLLATANLRGAMMVLTALMCAVLWTIGGAALLNHKLNFLNFIALPITFGIGCEYPFNIFDRSRLLKGDMVAAVTRSGGAVALCSYTTTVGYGSLIAADNQALQSFGWLAASGEIACLFVALFLLPSLFYVFSRKREGEKAAANTRLF